MKGQGGGNLKGGPKISVTYSRTEGAGPELNVLGAMSAWAAGAKMALNPVKSVSPSWDQVKVLNRNFWIEWLPRLVDSDRVDALIKGIDCGVSIGRSPADKIVESPNWPSAIKFVDKVSEIIRSDLETGRLLGPFITPPFDHFVVSPLGAIPKRGGGDKIRLIHDLSYPASESVNLCIDPEEYSLHYSSIEWAVSACAKFNSPFLAKIDIKDAYKAIGVCQSDWHLLGLKWQLPGVSGDYYFGKVLSFGLRSAPALFDEYASLLERIMPLAGVSGEIIRYVDDFLLVGPTESSVAGDLQVMIDIARQAGFVIQDSKVTPPSKVTEFLGIIVDIEQGILRISDERMAEVKAIVASCSGLKVVSKRRLLKVIGKLAFSARVVRSGRAFLGRLIGLAKSAKALHHKVRLSSAARADLEWWQTCIESHNGKCLINPDWSIGKVFHVFTDASDHGYGAVLGDQWFAMSYTGEAQCLGTRSINWRELHTAVKAIATWAPGLVGEKLLFHIDNQVTCFLLNKLYTPVTELMELVRRWCLIVEQYSIVVSVVYINTKDNVLADALSRGDMATFLSHHSGVPARVWPSPVQYLNEIV